MADALYGIDVSGIFKSVMDWITSDYVMPLLILVIIMVALLAIALEEGMGLGGKK